MKYIPSLLLVITLISYCDSAYPTKKPWSWIEKEHDFDTPPPTFLNDTLYEVPKKEYTPDFRLEEPEVFPFKPDYYMEEDRPYRMSPHARQAYRWSQVYNMMGQRGNVDHPFLLGCYCTTVYKRLTPLAGCAVLTTRHILTTATSTEMILVGRKHYRTLENILGAWYDIDDYVYNSSMYMSVSRIHYHPKYMKPEAVNASHPIPGIYDLALWASTYKFYGMYWKWGKTTICQRGGSSWRQTTSPHLPEGHLKIIVGFQFIWAYRRKPMPWFKYAVRTRKSLVPCPKTQWGWFICIPGDWARLGLDSGAALHMANERKNLLIDGLYGMNAFSMRLRSVGMVHYFTVLNCHSVLDWLYDAYMGRQPYEFLDYRFYNSMWRAPIQKPWFYIPWIYAWGDQYRVPFDKFAMKWN